MFLQPQPAAENSDRKEKAQEQRGMFLIFIREEEIGKGTDHPANPDPLRNTVSVPNICMASYRNQELRTVKGDKF